MEEYLLLVIHLVQVIVEAGSEWDQDDTKNVDGEVDRWAWHYNMMSEFVVLAVMHTPDHHKHCHTSLTPKSLKISLSHSLSLLQFHNFIFFR